MIVSWSSDDAPEELLNAKTPAELEADSWLELEHNATTLSDTFRLVVFFLWID